MFRFAQDLSIPVTLEANQLDPQSVVTALSTALKCNVFIDGFIDDIPAGKPGVYKAQEVLSIAMSAWKCTVETEGKNLCFIRDFSLKGHSMADNAQGPFPRISQEEMAAFTHAITGQLSLKYPASIDRADVGLTASLRDLTRQLTPAEQKQAETTGIVIGSLRAPLQKEFARVFCAQAFGDIVRPWKNIEPVLANLSNLKADIDYWKIQFSGSGNQLEIKTGISGEKPAEAEVEVLQQRLAKGCTRVADYARKTTLQAPPEIQRHFITAAALVDEPAFFAALAKLHGWKYRQEGAARVSLQPATFGNSVLPALPAEYRRFLLSATGPYSMKPFTETYIRWRGQALGKEAALYFQVFHKLIGKRYLLDLRTATEQETYVLTHLLFSGAAPTLGQLVTAEREPVSYVEDYKNATLATNRARNEFTVKHPRGGGFSTHESAFKLTTDR